MKNIFTTLVIFLSVLSTQAANTGVVTSMWNMEQEPAKDFLEKYDCNRNTTNFIVSANGAKCSQEICVMTSKCVRRPDVKAKQGSTPIIEITATCDSSKCQDVAACLQDRSVTSMLGNAVVTEGSLSDKQPSLFGVGVK